MMPTLSEIRGRQRALQDLHRAGLREVNQLWGAASNLSSREFQALMLEAFPELALEYNSAAGDMALTWYEDSGRGLRFQPAAVEPPVIDRFVESTRWALGAYGEDGLARLGGVLQRALFDGARAAVVENARSERGATWARYASANACAFCALMATRGAVYTTEGAATAVGSDRWEAYRRTGGRKFGTEERRRRGRVRGARQVGDKYHDDCKCIAVEVRPGDSYEPPSYVEKWEEAYVAASHDSRTGEYGVIDTKKVLAHMRENLGVA